ncbi:hypothetical protein GTA08_BOTSDO09135 [Neofusicoccum parvum]|uniref:Uncharacterized protein n=1 Tax=Neofusicoccum parvum TaxID=310453 RepID=A0ACB5SIN1_9PEZI|nr:hypothetical protein GTA08_BOTSDO09135 [Neofusicoccum parvum]
MASILECPFCGYTSRESYMIILHIEERHTDDSPFVVKEGPDAPAFAPSPPGRSHPTSPSNPRNAPSEDGGDDAWVLCPEPDCGEQIPLQDLNEHLDLHLAERLESQAAANSASTSTASQRAKMRQTAPSIASEHSFGPADHGFSEEPRHHRNSSQHHANGHAKTTTRPRSDSEKTTLSRSILDILTPSSGGKKLTKSKEPGSARLGKGELGPYAFEDKMPRWLYKQIEAGPKVTTINRISRDGRLIKHDTVDNETPGILPVLTQLCAIDRGVGQAYFCHPSTIHIFKRPNEGGFCGYRNIQMLVSYIQGAKAQGHNQFPPRTPGILILQDLIEQAWDMGINEISRVQTGGIRGTRKYIGTPEVQALLRSLRIDHGLQLFSDRPGVSQAHEQLLDYVESYFREGTTREQRERHPKIVKTHLPPIYLQQPGHSITIVGFERHKDGKRSLLVFDPMFHTSPGMHKILGRRDLRTPRPEVLEHFAEHAYVYAFFHIPSLDYDIIPEEHFPLVFPWWHYSGLFSTDDARFACHPYQYADIGDPHRFDHENVEIDTDTGLLGGVPPLDDKSYMHWMGLFDKKTKSINGEGFGQEARDRVNAALNGFKLEQDGDLFLQQPLPEDVFFEKSVEPADPVEKFHNRRDSGIGMIEQTPSFTNPFSTTPPSCAAAAVTETTICSHGHLISPINQQHEQHQEEFPLHQQHTSLPNGLHRTSTHNRHISRVALPNLLIHNSINTPYSPPKSPPAPPVLNLGSIDFFSSSTTTDAANPHLGRFGTANNRPPTPIHELRDFFYERSAETGEQTPVFYGTGGNNVSRGWRAKMGAEW